MLFLKYSYASAFSSQSVKVINCYFFVDLLHSKTRSNSTRLKPMNTV